MTKFTALLALCLACDPLTGTCTLIGCQSGLLVKLMSMPTGAYKVEVFANSPGSQPVYLYECDTTAGPCLQDIFFSGLVVTHPYIRVTSTAGVRTTEVLNLDYRTSRPNGPRCGPECRTAEVSAGIP